MKPQRNMKWAVVGAAALFALSTLASGVSAQSTKKEWSFRATGYGYFPNLNGTTAFPTPVGSDINIDADTLIKNTKFAVMGSFEAKKGRWGGFTDVMYFNVGKQQSGTRELTVPGIPLPPGVTADLDLDIKATVWTLGASFRAVDTARLELDVVGGARVIDGRASLDWSFNVPFGPFVGPAQQGSAEVQDNFWDAIGGVKGRINLDAQKKWFIPYYVDAGAGQSDLTWQGSVGLGYAMKRMEIIGAWRHLAYEMKPGARLADLKFNGPVIGLSFRW